MLSSVYIHYSMCMNTQIYILQVERAASEKAISAALAEEREKHNTIIADMKVSD